MTPQERQLLIEMFQRIDKAGDQPRDAEAEALIDDAVRQLPFAPYLLAQTVLVQEQALKAAGAKIEELQARVKALEGGSSGGSFLGDKSIYGSTPPTSVPTSVPTSGTSTSPWGRNAQDAMSGQSAPQWQQAPQQQPMAAPAQAPASGGGFLQGALGAAAGVAGGMLLANSIRGLFEGNHTNNNLGIGNTQSAGFGDSSRDAGALPGGNNTPDMSDIFPASHDSSGDSYDSGGYSDDTSDV